MNAHPVEAGEVPHPEFGLDALDLKLPAVAARGARMVAGMPGAPLRLIAGVAFAPTALRLAARLGMRLDPGFMRGALAHG